MLKGGEKVILVICDEGRYIPVQIVNPPAFSELDLPRCLELVKRRADAPVVAAQIVYKDDHIFKINYLAEGR